MKFSVFQRSKDPEYYIKMHWKTTSWCFTWGVRVTLTDLLQNQLVSWFSLLPINWISWFWLQPANRSLLCPNESVDVSVQNPTIISVCISVPKAARQRGPLLLPASTVPPAGNFCHSATTPICPVCLIWMRVAPSSHHMTKSDINKSCACKKNQNQKQNASGLNQVGSTYGEPGWRSGPSVGHSAPRLHTVRSVGTFKGVSVFYSPLWAWPDTVALAVDAQRGSEHVHIRFLCNFVSLMSFNQCRESPLHLVEGLLCL